MRIVQVFVAVLSVIFVFSSGVNHAQTPTQLGDLRLFLSAQQRARLDAMRAEKPALELKPNSQPIIKPTLKPILQTQEKTTPAPALTLQGYVKRGNGDNTVWLNHRAIQTVSSPKSTLSTVPMTINTGQVLITLPDKSVIQLKPGQRFEPKRKKIIDLVE